MSSEYYPRFSYISGITNAVNAVITFTDDHDFTEGEIVSFRVSRPYGMSEINNRQGKVQSFTSDTITVDIDTSTWTPYTYPVSGNNTPPVCVPSASGVVPGYTPKMNLEDSFDNRPD